MRNMNNKQIISIQIFPQIIEASYYIWYICIYGTLPCIVILPRNVYGERRKPGRSEFFLGKPDLIAKCRSTLMNA